MQFIPVKTRVMNPPQDDIYDLLDKDLPSLKEGDVVFITSKILAIHQGRCVKFKDVPVKDDLIKKEAEVFIPREECPGEHVILTLKENTLIPSAGIDESNSGNYYTFWPKNSNEEAKKICNYLKKKYQFEKLAVIITDSHTIPLRYGVLGISIGFFGLEPFKDYKGKQDIFGRKLKMTKSNIVDSLANMAVLLMGEGAEQIPIVIARKVDDIKFTNRHTYKKLLIPIKEDIYYPLLKKFYEKRI